MTVIKLKLLFLPVLVVSGLWLTWYLHTASHTSTFIRSSDQPDDAALAGTSPKFYRADVISSKTPDVKVDVTPFKSHRARNKDHAPDVKRSQTPHVKADVSKQDSITLPACPPVPPNLVGFKWIFKDVDKPMKTLEQEWGDILKPGGHYAPPDCLPKDRTAIIIPCRNRWPHLRILLNHLIPVLIRQQLSFSLFVLDSDQITHFNKGILLNAGFLEALKYGNYTCFVFQDVDMLTLNDKNLYRCGSQPKHLAVALDRFHFKFPEYGRYVGGALALSKQQVEKVNGYSNAYFGWGREDDDMEYRVRARGYDIFRMPLSMSQFHTLRHPKDKGNEQTVQSYLMIQKELVIKRMDVDGFRQAVYDIDWVHVSPLFTWIKIMVNETTVIENLPPYVRDIYKNGMTKVNCP